MVLREKYAELEDKYKRALADSENLRVRLMKQIDDAKLFGIQGFCKDLLDVADILGKATESVPKDEITERNPHLKSLYEGLIMTEAQLHKVFKKHGLISLNPLDEKFDPNQHEALFQQVDIVHFYICSLLYRLTKKFNGFIFCYRKLKVKNLEQ